MMDFLILGKQITDGLKEAFASIKTYPHGVLIVADGTFADGVHDILPEIVRKLRKKTPIFYKKHMHSCNTELRILQPKAKKWISKEKRKRDLIVTSFDVTGFESEVVIFIHNSTKSSFISPNYALRAICKLIIVNIDHNNPESGSYETNDLFCWK